jgi:hypothetical protein
VPRRDPPALYAAAVPGSAAEHIKAALLLPLAVAAEVQQGSSTLRAAPPSASATPTAVASWVSWLDSVLSLVTLSALSVLTLVEAGLAAEPPPEPGNRGGVWISAERNWDALRSALSHVAPALLDVFERGVQGGSPVPSSSLSTATWMLNLPTAQDMATWSDTPPSPPSEQALNTLLGEQGGVPVDEPDWAFDSAHLDNLTLQPFAWVEHEPQSLLQHSSRSRSHLPSAAALVDCNLLDAALEAAPCLQRRWRRGGEFSAPPSEGAGRGVPRFAVSTSVWVRLLGQAVSMGQSSGTAAATASAAVCGPSPEPSCTVGASGQQGGGGGWDQLGFNSAQIKTGGTACSDECEKLNNVLAFAAEAIKKLARLRSNA